MSADTVQEQIVKYLTDVHGTEEHAISMLKAGIKNAHDPRLEHALKDHLVETEEHERLVAKRLDQLGASPSKLKDVAQKGVAAVGGLLSGSAPDTTGKIAIEGFAFEHLEIASYRSLKAVADHAGDTETSTLAAQILEQEEAAAETLSGLLEEAALTGLPQSTGA